MGRKKVISQTIKESLPKKRSEIKEKKSTFITLPNDYKSRWDKIKGIEGKIVRFKMGESEKRDEYLNKKNYRQLYVGVDGNDLYFYYEILD